MRVNIFIIDPFQYFFKNRIRLEDDITLQIKSKYKCIQIIFPILFWRISNYQIFKIFFNDDNPFVCSGTISGITIVGFSLLVENYPKEKR